LRSKCIKRIKVFLMLRSPSVSSKIRKARS